MEKDWGRPGKKAPHWVMKNSRAPWKAVWAWFQECVPWKLLVLTRSLRPTLHFSRIPAYKRTHTMGGQIDIKESSLLMGHIVPVTPENRTLYWTMWELVLWTGSWWDSCYPTSFMEDHRRDSHMQWFSKLSLSWPRVLTHGSQSWGQPMDVLIRPWGRQSR